MWAKSSSEWEEEISFHLTWNASSRSSLRHFLSSRGMSQCSIITSYRWRDQEGQEGCNVLVLSLVTPLTTFNNFSFPRGTHWLPEFNLLHLNISTHTPHCSLYISVSADKDNFFLRLRASTVGDHSLHSRDLNVWFRGDIVRRN